MKLALPWARAPIVSMGVLSAATSSMRRQTGRPSRRDPGYSWAGNACRHPRPRSPSRTVIHQCRLPRGRARSDQGGTAREDMPRRGGHAGAETCCPEASSRPLYDNPSQRILEQSTNPGAGEGVVGKLPIHPVLHQLHLPQESELMGGSSHRPLGHLREVTNAKFLVRECDEDANPGRIRENREDAGDLLDRGLRRESLQCAGDLPFIDVEGLTLPLRLLHGTGESRGRFPGARQFHDCAIVSTRSAAVKTSERPCQPLPHPGPEEVGAHRALPICRVRGGGFGGPSAMSPRALRTSERSMVPLTGTAKECRSACCPSGSPESPTGSRRQSPKRARLLRR